MAGVRGENPFWPSGRKTLASASTCSRIDNSAQQAVASAYYCLKRCILFVDSPRLRKACRFGDAVHNKQAALLHNASDPIRSNNRHRGLRRYVAGDATTFRRPRRDRRRDRCGNASVRRQDVRERQESRRAARKGRHEGNEEGRLVSSMLGGMCCPLRECEAGPPPADARRVPQPVPRRVLRDVRAVHVHDPRCVSKLSNDYTAMFTRRPIARHSFSTGTRGRRPRQETRRVRRVRASPARAFLGPRSAGARRRQFLHL